MPGMAVILANSPASGLRTDIATMIAALTFPGHETAILVDEQLGVAAAHTAPRHTGGSRLGAAAGGRIAALVEGEPIGLPRSGPGLDPGSSPADRIAALYLAQDAAGLERLRGHWAAIILDRHGRTITIANDAFGIRPLYRMHPVRQRQRPQARPAAWLIATSPAALLAHPDVPRGVNPAGLADYLAFGFPLGQRTLFEGIDRLPAATILQYSLGEPTPTPGEPGALRERRYWIPVMRQRRGWSENDLEAIRCTFNQTVLDMVSQGAPTPGEPGALTPVGSPASALALSGGGDSRTILSALIAGGVPFETVTHAVAEATDTRLSRELAALAHVPHHFYEIRGEDIAPHVVEGVRMTAGQVAGIGVHPLACLPDYPAFTRAMLTGLGGNLYKGSFLSGEQDATQSSLPSLARWLTARHNHLMHTYHDFEPLLAPDWCAALRDQPERSVLETLERMSPETPVPRRSVVFYLEERTSKYLVKGDAFVRREIEVRHPFMDRELLLQAWAFPSPARARGIIPSYIITRNAPRLLDVPVTWAPGRGLPLRPYASTSWGRFTSHLSQLQENFQERRRRTNVTISNYRYGDWLRGALRPLVEGVLLDPRTLSRPWFRPETVRSWVAGHMAGQNRTDEISTLLGLELTLRMFVDPPERGIL